MYISMTHHLYIALCVYHPKSSLLPSPYIWPPLPFLPYMYWMEYCSAIGEGEILPSAATWMDLENIMLSKIRQTEKSYVEYKTKCSFQLYFAWITTLACRGTACHEVGLCCPFFPIPPSYVHTYSPASSEALPREGHGVKYVFFLNP